MARNIYKDAINEIKKHMQSNEENAEVIMHIGCILADVSTFECGEPSRMVYL
jgi:hypothetical protein